MVLEKDWKLAVVFDDNPIHMEAFKATFSNMGRIHLVECESEDGLDKLTQSPGVIMLNMEYGGSAPEE
jgi:hypothetical protein